MKDDTLLKRLILVKRLYLEGNNRASNIHNYSDQMIAVINFFLSIETIMGAVVESIDEQPNKVIGSRGYIGGKPSDTQVRVFKLGDYHKFEQLYNQIVAILRQRKSLKANEQLFNWNLLSGIHKARNEAQHAARAPHPSDLIIYRKTTLDFIERLLRLNFPEFGSSLAMISQADLIEDEVLREYLKNSESALERGNIRLSAFLVRIAFLLGRLKRRYDWWRDRKGSRVTDDFDLSFNLPRSWGGRALEERDRILLFYMMTEIGKLPRLYDDWVLGLEKVDRDKLMDITPGLIRHPKDLREYPPHDEVIISNFMENTIMGKKKWSGPDFRNFPTHDECLWALDFTTETIIRWQSEQQNKYTAVNTTYLEALPFLLEFDFSIENLDDE